MLLREDIEKREDEYLASYAMKSKDTRGRRYKEKEHKYRTCYQRDRDRIIHSTAFRRLEYKTQVFVNHEGDYYRTRLTHTIEVAQIARSISRALRLNEDLVETIALAHDLGHTPFGHSGEDILDEIMKDKGGFNHNLQSLRVVDWLEEKYSEFKGLNLTWEVREGIVKHFSLYDDPSKTKEFGPPRPSTIEAQVVDLADEIAYDSHDLDDGLASMLLQEEDLDKISLWKEVDIYHNNKSLGKDVIRGKHIRALIDLQVTDLIVETDKRIKNNNIKSIQDVRNSSDRIVSFSSEMSKKKKELRKFLSEKLYCHYRVVRMADKAKRFLESMFQVYLNKPEQLPPTSQERLKTEEPYVVICDYIAGMTDRYALDEYKKLFAPYEKV